MNVFNKRQLQALELRKQGMTLKQIGLELGVSRSRAEQILRDAERNVERAINDPHWGLSFRASNILLRMKLLTRREIYNAIESRKLSFAPSAKQKNVALREYGFKTHQEICVWLGVPTTVFCKLCRSRLRLYNTYASESEIPYYY